MRRRERLDRAAQGQHQDPERSSHLRFAKVPIGFVAQIGGGRKF